MQLAELIEIERPERAVHRRREHAQHDDDEEDVERRAEFDDERDSGGEQEGDERDPVVDEEQSDDLRDGLSARDEEEEAEQHRRQSDRREMGRGVREQGRELPAHQERDDDERRRDDERGRDVDQWCGLATAGITTNELAEQHRDDDALGDKDESRDDAEPDIVLVRGEHGGDDAERDPLDDRAPRRSPGGLVRHSVITPQTSTAPAARSSAST